jgi:uncharacterized membrane protein YdfJ with MMPL/SSD domain
VIDRLARLLGRRSGRVLLVAAAFFLLAGAVGAPVIGRLKANSSDFVNQAAPSVRAADLISHASHQPPAPGVVALVTTSTDIRTHATARGKVSRLAALLARRPGLLSVVDYPASRLPALVSADGRQSIVLATFKTQDDSNAAVDALRPRLAGHGIRFGGPDVAFAEIDTKTSTDLAHAEMIAIPILLVLSFWVFRGLVAALLPPLVGLSSILAALLGMRIVDGFTPLSIFALNLVTGMGVGLAIDYSLFIVSRYREELAIEPTATAAIRRTLQTAGRTVAFSALTVAGALAALLVFPLRFLYSMGIGGAIVALCAGIVSLTVLPAVLVVLGPRVNALAPAVVQRSRARVDRPAERGAWYRLGRAVMRRPGTIALAITAILVAFSLPALRLTLAPASALALPPSSETRQVSEALARDFPTDASQRITVVVSAPPTATARIAALAAQAGALADRLDRTTGQASVLAGHGNRTASLPAGHGNRTTGQASVRAGHGNRTTGQASVRAGHSNPTTARAGSPVPLTHAPDSPGPTAATTAPVRLTGAGASPRQISATTTRSNRRRGPPAAGPTIPRYLGADTWEIDVLHRGDPDSPANQQLVRSLRTLPVAAVGGPAATFVDQKQAIADDLPLAIGILALVTSGALFLLTGSLVLPAIALLMNLLTAGVAAALMVLIFQDGHLRGLLGFRPIGGLDESNLVLLLIVVFALSTDYGVFLLARIREARDTGLASRPAVAFGLERTGRLITAAALLFCVAIGAFATSQIFFVKQLGVGAVIAVGLDATAIRGLLVPALLGVLGDHAWWSPRMLRRLHSAIGPAEPPTHPAAAAAAR